MSAPKRISIDRLQVGMYVLELDQPWYKTPFFCHRFFVQNQSEIEQLKQASVRAVVVDTEKGVNGLNGLEVPDIDSSDDSATITQAPPSSEPEQTPPTASDKFTKVPTPQDLQEAHELYRDATGAVQRVFENIHTGNPVDRPLLEKVVVGLMTRLLPNKPGMLTQVYLQQMRRYDRSLSAHVVDVCILSLVVGVEQGNDEARLEALGMGALLHDVGYLRLPRNLFRKGGALNESEEKLRKQHPTLGISLLGLPPDLPEITRRIILEHHEEGDGSGFPAGLSGDHLLGFSRVVRLMDLYDRLVAGRNGEPALNPFMAIRAVFERSNTDPLDRILAEHIVQSLGVYPIGTFVQLTTGERGIVISFNVQDRLRPTIRLVTGEDGKPMTAPSDMDLAELGDRQSETTIQRVLDPERYHVNVEEYFRA